MKSYTKFLAMVLPVAALTACGEEAVELPYGTPQQFMANEVQPTATIYWDAVGAVSELIDGEPVFREFEPETDEEWEEIRLSAVRLQELSDTLASPAYAGPRSDDWLDFAEGLKEISVIAEQAAVDHDPEAVFEIGGTIYAVCTACHQIYPADAVEDDNSEASVRPTMDQSLEEYAEETGE